VKPGKKPRKLVGGKEGCRATLLVEKNLWTNPERLKGDGATRERKRKDLGARAINREKTQGPLLHVRPRSKTGEGKKRDGWQKNRAEGKKASA